MNEVDKAKYCAEIAAEFDNAKFKETYNILKKAQRLKPKHFKLVEKQKLIQKLQDTIKHATTLLFELENDLK